MCKTEVGVTFIFNQIMGDLQFIIKTVDFQSQARCFKGVLQLGIHMQVLSTGQLSPNQCIMFMMVKEEIAILVRITEDLFLQAIMKEENFHFSINLENMIEQ